MVSYTQSPLLASLRRKTWEPPADLRRYLCNQLILGLEQYYVHLPQKRAGFAIDPVQALTLLRESDGKGYLRSLLRIVASLRDRHTTLQLGAPWTNLIAYVPFIIERVAVNGQPRYLLSKRLYGYTDIPVGATISHWNGVPIDLYVNGLADETQGANDPARLRLAVANLTVRPLAYLLMPSEDWVTVTYYGTDGALRTVSTPWRYFVSAPLQSMGSASLVGEAAALEGLDKLLLLTNRFERDAAPEVTLRRAGLVTEDPFRYGTRATISGPVGYLRIFNFDTDPTQFVNTTARILAGLPQDKLIVDIRNNPGGQIPAGQKLLRLLTDKPLDPAPVAFRSTESTLRVSQLGYFFLWHRSIALRTTTGMDFSQSFPLSTYQDVPDYRYPGKVALIIDALCYSTSDFFSADFSDNRVGIIVGVDPTTGGGGANVWTWDFLAQTAASVGGGPLPLPGGYNFNISVRRCLRTGVNAGIPVEDFGIPADFVRELTLADVLGDNADLINFVAAKLSAGAGPG